MEKDYICRLKMTLKMYNKNQNYVLIYAFFLALLICFPGISYSQTNSDGQLWLDAELNYTYKQRFLFQDELSYQTLISGGNKWYSLNSTPAFEYNLNSHFDLISAVPLSYTLQNDGLNTFEVRAMVGTRVYLTPTKRAQLRALVRWENRWSHDEKNDTWDIGNRLRLRAECVYPLNKHTYFEDKMWYWLNDFEIFLTTSKDIPERFANRARLRTGIGYRLNYKLRFEAIYTCQFSRNTINDKFDSQSNILRLRLKYYFK